MRPTFFDPETRERFLCPLCRDGSRLDKLTAALKEIALEDSAASHADPRNLAAKARTALGMPTDFIPYKSETMGAE